MARRRPQNEKDVDLHSVCRRGRIKEIERHLERHDTGMDINAHDQFGETPLHALMSCKDESVPEIIDLLVEHGADVNAASLPEGDTCMHKALRGNISENLLFVMISLLEHDADPMIKNKSMRTAYDVAVSMGHTDLIKFLDGFNEDPEKLAEELQEVARQRYGRQLINAVINTDEDGIDRCLANFPPLNMLNGHGAGAIHYAITHYRGDVIALLERLIKADADVNYEDHEGDTALNLALKTRRLKLEGSLEDVVQFLVETGTNPTIEDIDGNDAVALAHKYKHEDLLDLLDEAVENQKMTEQEKRDRISERLNQQRETQESRVRLRDSDDDMDEWTRYSGSDEEEEEEVENEARKNWGKAKSKASTICIVS